MNVFMPCPADKPCSLECVESILSNSSLFNYRAVSRLANGADGSRWPTKLFVRNFAIRLSTREFASRPIRREPTQSRQKLLPSLVLLIFGTDKSPFLRKNLRTANEQQRHREEERESD